MVVNHMCCQAVLTLISICFDLPLSGSERLNIYSHINKERKCWQSFCNTEIMQHNQQSAFPQWLLLKGKQLYSISYRIISIYCAYLSSKIYIFSSNQNKVELSAQIHANSFFLIIGTPTNTDLHCEKYGVISLRLHHK